MAHRSPTLFRGDFRKQPPSFKPRAALSSAMRSSEVGRRPAQHVRDSCRRPASPRLSRRSCRPGRAGPPSASHGAVLKPRSFCFSVCRPPQVFSSGRRFSSTRRRVSVDICSYNNLREKPHSRTYYSTLYSIVIVHLSLCVIHPLDFIIGLYVKKEMYV